MDILNVIRQNASQEYQDLVPEVTSEKDIPKVGEVLYGYPAMANQFISALVNRIASVRVKSATFNNPYVDLKKGFLEFGETVEEVFVQIAKAREFNPEKGPQREFKRTIPDVRSAFHLMNWNVQYPVTVTDTDLQKAFLSMDGVQDLIARIVDSIYKAAEYDEYLLFKYLLIKGISHGKLYPISIGDGTAASMNEAAVAFRGTSNQITFLSDKYNESGVRTNTSKDDQYIFMDSTYNAQYDVNVLAAAFNMDKAEFTGKLKLIDDWTTFDNERFDEIRANSDMIEEVTDEELALMEGVKAVIVDGEWFQVYDNVAKFTEKYVASGDYWNYFFRVQKTISHSPFSNAIVFVTDTTPTVAPETLTFTVSNKSVSVEATVLTLVQTEPTAVNGGNASFVQSEAATSAGIAVHPYGAVIYPAGATNIKLAAECAGAKYETANAVNQGTIAVGDTVTLNKAE